MAKTLTIEEAKDALQSTWELLDRIEKSLGMALGKTREPTGPHVSPPTPPTPTAQNASSPPTSPAPKGFNDKMLKIIGSSPMPMMPKQVVDQYQSLNWPAPGGDLYKRVMSAIFYLKGKGKLVRKETGYSLP